ncbi:MAG: YdcF family protein [Clostridia bacterium]|nr:YdcF family protein [Clostridia bacterium]
MAKFKKTVKILSLTLALLTLCGIVTLFSVNGYVKDYGRGRLLSLEEAAKLEKVDCILVLGCYVHPDGNPSDMLADRIKQGIALYEKGASDKLLMSGDHGQTEYNEVFAMKQTALDAGVPSSDIFMDHAGFSTYESLYRAREIFGAKKILIVSQEYHLYRALHVAKELGLEAYGVSADLHSYWGQQARDTREVLARAKDFVYGILKPKPTYLGDPITIKGDGDVTNDEKALFKEEQIT